MTQVILAASNALHIDAVLDYFRDLVRAYQRRRNINITMKELNQLTDAELWDIGLSRGEIYDVAQAAFPKAQDAKADANDNLKGWV